MNTQGFIFTLQMLQVPTPLLQDPSLLVSQVVPQIQSQFTWGLQTMSTEHIHGDFSNRALLIMTEVPDFINLLLFFFPPLFSPTMLEIGRLSPCCVWLSHFPVGNGVT